MKTRNRPRRKRFQTENEDPHRPVVIPYAVRNEVLAKYAPWPIRISLILALCIYGILLAGGVSAPIESPLLPSVPPPVNGATSAESIDLGNHTFKVSTTSPEAQRAFDRGLTFAYAFSHLAAEAEFRRAALIDPECAMAWWGIALVNGPHINFPAVPAEREKTAVEALAKAQSLAPKSSELERALINALAKRHPEPLPDKRAGVDEAYGAAMREVWRAFPGNADVATLSAEALMNLHPWDLWETSGAAKPWTPEIVTVLERALDLNPAHPGANHLYIHAVEASPNPEKALPVADRLASLAPGASHLVHMPSHIYVRLGRWAEAANSNANAMKADKLFRAAYPNPGFYAMYMAHNEHFYAFASMMRGQGSEAIKAARNMVGNVPEEFVRDYGQVADGYMVFPSKVLMRFGKWEKILKEPEPRAEFPLARALWHFTRATALNALGRPDETQKEREAFLVAAAKVPEDRTFGNNRAADLLAIATKVLDGEIAAKADRLDESIELLREAARLQDQLKYDEPPDWVQPVRHTLGAVYLRAKRPADAEMVYREDLAQYPENGWSLFGLSRALQDQGKSAEAKEMQERFTKAWSAADNPIDSTCYCLPSS